MDDVPENVAAVVAGEVEVTVMGEVADRGFIRGRTVVDDDLVVVGQGVAHAHGEVAGVAFFFVGAAVGELDAGAGGTEERFALPVLLVEAFLAAVEVVGVVVRGEGVLGAVDLELALGDAVGRSGRRSPRSTGDPSNSLRVC